MTIVLRELLATISRTVEKHPEVLDYPVFVNETGNGIFYTNVAIGNATLTEDDIDCGNFDEDDIGRKYVAIFAE